MDRFVKLIVDKPLSRKQIRTWFNCVVENAPDGIVHAVTVEDDDGNRHVVRLTHQTMAKRHAYVIPITRDLLPVEMDRIVEAFAEQEPDLDFDAETNETRLIARDQNTIPLDAEKHLALCLALAKRKHEDWVRERSDAGWRFGMNFDADDKVHPLLRPWDQLPERYRTPDLTGPQQLISMLNDSGYVVVRRDELADLMNRVTPTVR